MTRERGYLLIIGAVIIVAAVIFFLFLLSPTPISDLVGPDGSSVEEPVVAVEAPADTGDSLSKPSGSEAENGLTTETETPDEDGNDVPEKIPGETVDGQSEEPPEVADGDSNGEATGNGVMEDGTDEDENDELEELLANDSAVVYGTVIDAETGKAVARETSGRGYIRLMCKRVGDLDYSSAAGIDENGYYRIRVKGEIPFVIKVISKGWGEYTSDILTLTPGEERNFDIVLVIKRTILLTGIVTDDDTGAPVEYVDVVARPIRLGDLTNIDQKFKTYTDADGRYSVYVAPGVYQVITPGPAGYYEYYENEIEIVKTTTLNIRLIPKPRAAAIEGYVTDAETGLAIANVLVHWYGGDDRDDLMTDDSGYYRGEVLSGKQITIYIFRWGYLEIMDEYPAIDEEEVLRLDFRLKPTTFAFIGALARDAVSGEPVSNAQLNLISRGPNKQDSQQDTRTDQDGRFLIIVLDANRTMEIALTGYKLKSLDLSKLVLRREDEIEISFEPYMTGIFGDVLDGVTRSCLPGVKIVFKNRRKMFDLPYSGDIVYTGADGSFMFRTEPGVYEISCNPKGYVVYTQAVEVGEGGLRRFDISLFKPDTVITGRVFNAVTGDLVANAKVTAYVLPAGAADSDYYWGIYRTTVTTEDGRFRIEAAQGAYRLYVDANGFEAYSLGDFYVSRGSAEELSVGVYALDAAIFGKLVDAETGTPLNPISVGLFRDLPFYPNEYIMRAHSVRSRTNETEGSYNRKGAAGEYNISCNIEGYYYYEADVRLSAGYKLKHDIELVSLPPAAATVTGTAIDAESGQTLSDVRVAAYLEKSVFASCETDTEGRFEIGVPEGAVILRLWKTAYVTPPDRTLDIKKDDILEVELEMAPVK